MNECRMAAAGDDQIIEGFLCPICRQDLRSDSNLLNHFQEVHSEEQAILKSIKGTHYQLKQFHIIHPLQICTAKQRRKS